MASAADLRAALAGVAAEDLPAVLAAAREAARRDAVEVLRAALVEELLAQARGGRPVVEGDAWWVYGVVGRDEGELVGGLTGVEEAPVELVSGERLAALVSRVPLAEYGDAALRGHLEDIAWVERTARAHEGVLEQAMRRTTVVPLRLCTIFTRRAAVSTLLDDERLVAALERLEGRSEYGLKIFAGRLAVPAGLIDARGDARAWVDRKRRERRAREEAERVTAECAQACHEALCAVALDSRLNPVQRREAHGRDADMILNGAYLAADGEELEGVLEPLRERFGALGYEIELTGPWPPFNFVGEP